MGSVKPQDCNRRRQTHEGERPDPARGQTVSNMAAPCVSRPSRENVG